MRNRLAWMAGALGAAGVAYRALRRRPSEAPTGDPRADELRRKLDDSKSVPDDRAEFEAGETAVDEVSHWLDEGVRTYVHCRAGWQRSAAVAAGVVALRDGIDVDQALEQVQVRKPTADPLPHQREDMRRWWRERTVAEEPGSRGGEGPALREGEGPDPEPD